MGRPNINELKPWAGLIAGFGAAGLQHQLVTDVLRFECSYGRAALPLGLAALIVIAIGASISWGARRAEVDPEASRKFVANLSLLAAAISVLFVGWMTLAGSILPACVR